MKRIVFLALVIGTAALLAACAAIEKPDLSNLNVPVAAGSGTAAVAAIDMRDGVMTGRTDVRFEGRIRKASLEWVDILTASGRPLADDLAASVSKSLTAGGYAVQTVSIPPGTSRKKALAVLEQTGATRLVLLEIKTLEFEHYRSTRLAHDLTLAVVRSDGLKGAEASTTGDSKIGNAGNHQNVRSNVETAVRTKLRALLENRYIAEALAQ